MRDTLKSKRIEYCKVTDNPYSYNRYVEQYPNIKIKRSLFFDDPEIMRKKEYSRRKQKEYKMRKLNMQKLINEKRKALWIII